MKLERPLPRLFIGTYPTGISYADRHREEHGDYKRVAFLPFATLDLRIEGDVADDLRAEVVAHAETIRARAGGEYEVSACGQTVWLGSECERAPCPHCADGSCALCDDDGKVVRVPSIRKEV